MKRNRPGKTKQFHKGRTGKGDAATKAKRSSEPAVDLCVEVSSAPVLPPEKNKEDSKGDDTDHRPWESILKQALSRLAVYQHIWSVPSLLTPAECQAWIEFGELSGYVVASQKAGGGYAHRENGRFSFHDVERANLIFSRIQKCLPQMRGQRAVGCSPNLRMYRYVPGQRFGKHIDESNYDEGLDADSEFTLLLYLNEDGLEGGETVRDFMRKRSRQFRHTAHILQHACTSATLLHTPACIDRCFTKGH
jgi:hypothetical protein